MGTPTQPAQKYLNDLIAGREIPAGKYQEHIDALLADIEAGGRGPDGKDLDTAGRTSRAIDWLKRQPKTAGAAAGTGNGSGRSDIESPGVFVYPPGEGSVLYVVRWSRRKGESGERHLYACELVELKATEGDRMDEHFGEARFKHVFDPEAHMMRYLREEHRMPVSDLESFMLKYSQCVNCGLWLKLFTSQNHTTPSGNPTPMGDTCYENCFGHEAMLDSKRRAREKART